MVAESGIRPITPPAARIVEAILPAGLVCLFRCHDCHSSLMVLNHPDGARTWVKCLKCQVWYCLVVHIIDTSPQAHVG